MTPISGICSPRSGGAFFERAPSRRRTFSDAGCRAWQRGMSPIYALCLTFTLSSTALAAEGAPTGPSEAVFIAQIVLLLLVGRLIGEVMQRVGQPAVMGQLIAGVLLGPSVFGVIWLQTQHAIFSGGHEQKAMLEAVSSLGILMLLLLTGMETDLKLVKRARRAAVSVSAAGIIVPFVCGFVLGEFLPA